MYNDNALSAIYADIARLNKARVQISHCANNRLYGVCRRSNSFCIMEVKTLWHEC